jgi:hypothetical protein
MYLRLSASPSCSVDCVVQVAFDQSINIVKPCDLPIADPDTKLPGAFLLKQFKINFGDIVLLISDSAPLGLSINTQSKTCLDGTIFTGQCCTEINIYGIETS